MPVPVLAEQLEPAFARLAREIASGRTPVAGLAVGDANGLVREAVYSAQATPPHTAKSVFFLASLTKPIFATAVMQLVEDGLLDLHEPLAGHLSEFGRPPRDRITTWHLLTHTSGLEDISFDYIRRTRPSNRQLTELALMVPVQFEPGTRYAYASSSYFVLAELARRLTGEPPRAFLQRRVLDPLGMASTGFDPRRLGAPVVPVAGVGADSRLRRFLLVRYLTQMAHPGGGLFGTLGDLARFGAALLAPRRNARGRWVPLSPATVALMAEDHTRGLAGKFDNENRRVHQGLAWSKPTLMGEWPGGPDVIAHGGASGTRLWIDPSAELVFVYLGAEWDASRELEQQALRAVYEALGLDSQSRPAGGG